MAAPTPRDPAAPDPAPAPPRAAATPPARPVPTLTRATPSRSAGVPGQAASAAPFTAPLTTPTWTAALPVAPLVVPAPAYAPPVVTPAPVTGSLALTPPPGAPAPAARPALPEPAHVPLSGPIPAGSEAVAMLRRHRDGAPPASPGAGAVLDRALDQLSDLERHAFAGDATPIDPALLGKVSGARVQVEYALALLDSERVELELVEALLGEVDGIRLRLKALAPSVDVALAGELKRIAAGLVERAMELSTRATQQLTGAVALPAAAPEPLSPAVQAPPGARVLSNERAGERTPPTFRTKALAGVLAAAVLVAGGYHGWRFLHRPRAELPTMSGAPANTFVTTSANSAILRVLPGKSVDAAELEQFRRAQMQLGRIVRQASPGMWILEGAAPPRGDRGPHRGGGK